MPELGVNIDHVATLRQARKGTVPDPVEAANICEKAGCDSIVCHLREDRRHIHDRDLLALRKTVRTRLNMEMSIASEIVDIACSVRPDLATLVPERRQEVTTEGGLEVIALRKKIERVVTRLRSRGIKVSLFVDPDMDIVKASADTGAEIIELHTGNYANARTASGRARELDILKKAVKLGLDRGLAVSAGHGLDYANVKNVACISGLYELNIGHSIVSYAVFYGLERAVKKMIGVIS